MTEHEKRIAKAEDYLRGVAPAVAIAPHRQRWHFMPPAGWMNDPNGLIHFKGHYHLFYQFNPYAAVWGAMHWGHAVSRDLLHWKHMPIALAPSESYDNHERGGCFSGSAVDDGGRLALMYTATTNHGDGFVQTQCVAFSDDGVRFQKLESNPVIGEPPAEGSRDFRDPKVWRHGAHWYVVIGSSRGGQGKALLYRSPDLRQWDYVGVLAESKNDLGSMWECPDCFPLGDRHVLMFSPMHLGERKTVYLVGDLDYATGAFRRETIGEVDWGFDYYAPQSFVDDRGRRIIIGWQNAWDWMPWWKDFGPTHAEGWCGSLAMPRTVELAADNRLVFRPVAEMAGLRRNPFSLAGSTHGPEGRRLEAGGSISYEIEVEWDRAATSARTFGLKLRSSRKHETLLFFDSSSRELVFDRSRSGFHTDGIRRCRAEMRGDTIELHAFVDTCSIEAFTDGGRTAMSNNIFTNNDDTGVSLFCGGGKAKVKGVRCWELDRLTD